MATAATENDATENVETEAKANIDKQARLLEAQSIVKTNVLWSMGVGVLPVPIIDLLGITAVQLKMLKKLSEHYDIPFSEHKVKNIVASLAAGLGSVGIGGAVAFSVFKLVPFMGHLAGAVAIPVAAGAFTYATGTIFIQHFESGGTFLDFDPAAVRAHFRQEFEEAKAIVKEMKDADDDKKKN